MKKLFSALLVLTLLLSCLTLTSCDKKLSDFKGMTPAEAYVAAMEEFATLDNYTLNHTMEFKGTTFLFFSQKYSSEIEIKVDGRDWENSITWHFEEDEYEYYAYVGEVYYENVGNVKTRCALSYDREDEFIEGDHAGLIRLPSEWLIDAQFYSSREGTYIEVTVDGQAYFDYLFVIGEEEPLDGEPEGDVTYRVYLNDAGQITKIWTKMTCIIEEDGVRIKTTMTDTMVYSDIGTTAVTPPADADSYHEGSFY